MTSWTLENAKNGFSEVVRRALSDGPQIVTRGRRADEAVVIMRLKDYERLMAPRVPVLEFFQKSPLAAAVREGLFAEHDPFPRDADTGRDVSFG